MSPLEGSPYQAYLYGYPHKTAYRPFERPVPLREVWADERKDALFLYVHVPFCAMRCGFCNLFTAANPVEDVVARYLDALERETWAFSGEVGPVRFARAAIGGGTPSFLEPAQLQRVLDLMQLKLGAVGIPLSVELSPETTSVEKARLLGERGATRISIGVQSFVPSELAALKRPQQNEVVASALDAIRPHAQTLNIDLIYGIEGQTEASFIESLRAALKWSPEELYLYPLYVRPLTTLGRAERQWDDQRLSLYRVGRDWLRANGYQQVSMRMFRRQNAEPKSFTLSGGAAGAGVEVGRAAATGALRLRSPSGSSAQGERDPVYRCQEDGMVGLGCGARSYTRLLHYSQEFAVASREVRGIIDAYSARDEGSFRFAHYGHRLDAEDLLRRRVILSLLSDEGLALDAAAAKELSQLDELEARGLARRTDDRLSLTDEGLERSDAIGPWLQSERVSRLMKGWQLR